MVGRLIQVEGPYAKSQLGIVSILINMAHIMLDRSAGSQVGEPLFSVTRLLKFTAHQ
jgi:hypothetical protein